MWGCYMVTGFCMDRAQETSKVEHYLATVTMEVALITSRGVKEKHWDLQCWLEGALFSADKAVSEGPPSAKAVLNP